MQPRDGKVPLFVFPSSLTFYLEDRTTHKQILTLYNPYEFPIKFKVLCTKSKNYSVVDSEGLIKPLNRIDIVVRHNAPTISNCGIDKFRIQMIDATTKQIIGKKDVQATLKSEKQINQIDNGEVFKNIPSQPASFRESFGYRNFPGTGFPSSARCFDSLRCRNTALSKHQAEDGRLVPTGKNVCVLKKISHILHNTRLHQRLMLKLYLSQLLASLYYFYLQKDLASSRNCRSLLILNYFVHMYSVCLQWLYSGPTETFSICAINAQFVGYSEEGIITDIISS